MGKILDTQQDKADPKKILVFGHSTRATLLDKITEILSSIEPVAPFIQVLDETRQFPKESFAALDAIIILYTPELEKDETLYQIIQALEKREKLESFLILPPQDESVSPFPALFHTVRFQPHSLLHYKISETGAIDIRDVCEAIREKLQTAHDEEGASPPHKSFWKRIIYLIPFIIALALGIIKLFPSAYHSLSNVVTEKTSLRPPAMEKLWLQESFDLLDTETVWTQTHKFKGKNYFSIDLGQQDLQLSADAAVEDVIYELESREQWALDDLQALQASFNCDPLGSADAEAFISFQLVLTENPEYLVGCWIKPGQVSGTIQCFIKEPEEELMLSNAIPFSLKEWHTFALVFDPQKYAMQFFLDDEYYGEADIPDVKSWRERDFVLKVNAELQNLDQGNSLCRMDDVFLAEQP